VQPETSALPIAQGQIIAERYLVGEVLGGGGMGVVCAGTHVLLGTPVAIKLIHPELKDDHEAMQRFVNEARATAALKGEHIARVFDVGLLPSGEPFLVMEQLEGLSLDDYLRGRGPVGQAEAIAIALQVCEGLAEAHAAGLVHRDIKPANLFLARRPDGQSSVKILDFGIAKQPVRTDDPGLTNPGKSLGSPWYMSPEQMVNPAGVDQRGDVWSIGVLLFELLTSRVPFDGESVPQVCATVLTASPPRPSEIRADVAPELDAVVLRCLEKEPERRFASVSELAQALLPFAAGPLTVAAPTVDDAATGHAAPEPAAFATPLSLNYDSLTPLHTGSPNLASHRVERRAWPLAMTLVTLTSLLCGGWLQYRDPTLVHRVLSATRLNLPWDPQLSSTSAETVLERTPPFPAPLQTRHSARAVLETRHVKNAAPPPVASPSHERGRAQSDETPSPTSWKRLTEDRYGL
jgi:eukaryotic-like serine/threonine-protein kinase